MKRLVAVLSKVSGSIHVLLAGCLVGLAYRVFGPYVVDASGRVASFTVPPLVIVAGLAVWLVVLGFRSWRRAPGWIAALSWTHAIALFFAGSQLVFGWIAMRGAERSAAHGGGLLGGLGYIQVLVGLGLAGFALLSLLLVAVAVASERAR